MPYYCKNCNIEYEQTSRTYKCLKCGELTVYGDKKFCPQCKTVRNTTCSACGCGSCLICGYRFCCIQLTPSEKSLIKLFPLSIYTQYQNIVTFSLEYTDGAGI